MRSYEILQLDSPKHVGQRGYFSVNLLLFESLLMNGPCLCRRISRVRADFFTIILSELLVKDSAAKWYLRVMNRRSWVELGISNGFKDCKKNLWSNRLFYSKQ